MKISIPKLLNRFFHLHENKTTITRECLAGLTAFSTVAYAILLVPTLLSQTGMDFGSAMTATLLAACLATLLMSLLANYPFVLAPGVALSAYFTYSVVIAGENPWQIGLGIVFICGVIFLLLNLLHIRQFIILVIPLGIRLAVTAGLGFFLAFIGLKNAGIIVDHPSTLVTFGDPTSHTAVLTAIGVILIGTLMTLQIPGALFFGIVILWLIGILFKWVPYKGLISLPASLAPTFFQLDLRGAGNFQLINVLISFLFVSLFDTSGTLIGLGEEGKFIKESHKRIIFPRLSRALFPDAIGSIASSLLGSSTIAIYLESVSGIAAGGRTGLTALVVGLLFLGALFFTPFASSIPLFATAPVLLVIGGMMMRQVGRFDWDDPSEWIPGFIVVILIPLTYSVATGVAVGFILFPLIKLLTGKAKSVHWLSWVLCILFIFKFIFI